MDKGRLGESYTLAGEIMSFEDMIGYVTELAGSRPPRLKLPLWLARAIAVVDEGLARLRGTRPLISQESMNSLACSFALSSEKARKELGFKPRPNREGFEQTIRWIKAQARA